MTFKKGQITNPTGPKPGTKSVLSREKAIAELNLREQLLDALRQAGGVEYLKALAESNPAVFANLIKSVIPKEKDVIEVTGPGGGPQQIEVVFVHKAKEKE